VGLESGCCQGFGERLSDGIGSADQGGAVRLRLHGKRRAMLAIMLSGNGLHEVSYE
jgi:hypothetical protein